MKKEELEAIKRRCDAATAGPWRVEHGINVICADGKTATGATGTDAEYWHNRDKSNAEFIAHARTDIPNLIEEIEKLQEQVSELRRKLYEVQVRAGEIIEL